MTRKSSVDVRSDAERGRLMADLLAGSWRATPPPADFAAADLNELAPLLCQTGSAGLGWWKIRGQRSEIRGQRSEIRGQRSEIRGQRREFDRGAVTESSRGLSAQRDTPGIDRQSIADPERVKHQRSEIRDQRREFDRGAVTESSRGLSAQRDTPGTDGRDGSDPEGVEAAKALLHDAYRQFRISALVHAEEIKHIFSLLRAEGIEPVLVKGWAIARHYPDPALRPYGDIDLCVRPDQFAAAARALKSLESLDGHYVDLHEGFAKLELATRFSRRSRAFRVPTLVGPFSARKSPTEVGTLNTALWDELFERSHLVSLGSPRLGRESPARDVNHRGAEDPEEIKVRVLSDEDHLRLLCLHLLRSGAWRPLWLCDVAVALETRRPDFAWDVCLTRDPQIAEWVAATIGLAQELLGAEREAESGKREAESGKREAVSGKREAVSGKREAVSGKREAVSGKREAVSGKREAESGKREAVNGEARSSRLPLAPSRLPLTFSRLPLAPSRLPHWLAPAVLRQWGRSLNPHALEMALPALASRKRDARKFFAEMYARWDQPVRATVALRGRFDNRPRWPYQLAELLLRSSEVPKQLRRMFGERERRSVRQAAAIRFARETGG